MPGDDRELLGRFVERRDEAAFAELVSRHGPMVMGACRRALGGLHDAEDAFQATFLLLPQKAARLRKRGSVAGWLYRVARNASLRVRQTRAKRTETERRAAEMRGIEKAGEVDTEVVWSDLGPMLDEELMRLPERLRAVVVMCLIEGRPGRDTAAEIGRTERTVQLRLEKARAILRKRFLKRGVAIPVALLATLLSENASAAVPATCASAAVSSASAVASGAAVAAGSAGAAAGAGGGAISAKVASLAAATAKVMLLAKLKATAVAAVVGLTVAACGTAAVTKMRRKLAGEDPATPPETTEIAWGEAVNGLQARSGAVEVEIAAKAEAAERELVAQSSKDAGATPPPEEDEASKREIRRKLEWKISLTFEGTPLKEVIAFLEEGGPDAPLTGITVRIDRRAIDVLGDRPITFKLNNASLEEVLAEIVRLAEHEYRIEDDGILIYPSKELLARAQGEAARKKAEALVF